VSDSGPVGMSHSRWMNDGTPALTTSRLRLVPATRAIVDAELEGHERLAEVLAAVLPPDWPPEHHDIETLRFWRDASADPVQERSLGGVEDPG
jgi:hypothetical protein